MKIDKLLGLSPLAFALGLILGIGTVRAEPDVLSRPALMLSAQRLANAALLDVKLAGKRLVAVGERGVIQWSDDLGQHWQQAKVPVTVTLTSLSFADESNGWAVGHSGVILGTKDGGQTWNKLLDGERVAQIVLKEVQKPGVSEALRANAERLVADGPDKPFLSVHFTDANNGFVVGAYGLILRTQNGGATWHSIGSRIDNPKGLHLYAIQQDGDLFYLFGEQGAIYVSLDMGTSFRAMKTPYQGTYFGGLVSGKRLLAFGMRGNAYWSADQGQSWQKSTLPTANTLTAGRRLGSGEIVLLDDGGGVHVSRDEGRSFSRIDENRRTPLTGLAELSAGTMILAGTRGISHVALKPTALEGKQ